MVNSRVLVALIVVCVIVFLIIFWTWRQLERALLFAPVVGRARPSPAGVREARLRQLNLWIMEAQPEVEAWPSSAPRSDQFSGAEGPAGSGAVVVFFHGNFGNLEDATPLIELLRCFGANVVAFDYSGYGASRGRPSTEQILSDGVLVYDYARDRWPEARVILWGHSLGTSVATFVAGHLPCDGLVLMAPFYALTELGRDFGGIYRFLSATFSPFVNLLPTNEWIRRVDCPVVIVHSLRDNLIPYRHALLLYEELLAARMEKRRLGSAEAARSLLLLPTAGNHACNLLMPSQLAALAEFLSLPARLEDCAAIVDAARRAPECR
jgi:pimeloyl-ACP methyl ester carboxylesterase